MATNSKCSDSHSPSKHLTVIDVYDMAESINRDLEILAGKYGNDSFESIVKNIISALETLEALARRNEKENSEIFDLYKKIERFEHEKQQRLRDKENLERDAIELEENYKKEIDELCKIINKLQEENKNMKERIASGENTEEYSKNELAEEQLQALIDLRKMTHTQKDQIKELQKDLDSYCKEVGALRDNIERLIQQNKELLRKNNSLQKQGRTLLLERAEIMRRLQLSEEAGVQLRRMLNETNRACKDLELQKQQDESPRFTLSELREVLQEKNALKTKVMELEEKVDRLQTSSPGIPDNFEFVNESTPATTEENLSTEESIVFGPINREPDEKLYPWKYERKNSGIRRFFRIFTAISPSGISPRSSGSK